MVFHVCGLGGFDYQISGASFGLNLWSFRSKQEYLWLSTVTSFFLPWKHFWASFFKSNVAKWRSVASMRLCCVWTANIRGHYSHYGAWTRRRWRVEALNDMRAWAQWVKNRSLVHSLNEGHLLSLNEWHLHSFWYENCKLLTWFECTRVMAAYGGLPSWTGTLWGSLP